MASSRLCQVRRVFSLFALACCIVATPHASAQQGAPACEAGRDPYAEFCERFAVYQQLVNLNTFPIHRTLRDQPKVSPDRPGGYFSYLGAFAGSFANRLSDLNASQCWIDAGAGLAGAAREYLAPPYNGRGSVVAMGLKKPKDAALEGDLKNFRSRFVYAEQSVEHQPLRELCPGGAEPQVISDIFGAFSYSPNPVGVLARYLEALPVGGQAFIATEHSVSSWHIASYPDNPKDFGYTPLQWLQQVAQRPGSGFSVAVDSKTGAAHITKTAHEFRVPELVLIPDWSLGVAFGPSGTVDFAYPRFRFVELDVARQHPAFCQQAGLEWPTPQRAFHCGK